MSETDFITRLDRLEEKVDLLLKHLGIVSKQQEDDPARIELEIKHLADLHSKDRNAFFSALKKQNSDRRLHRGRKK